MNTSTLDPDAVDAVLTPQNDNLYLVQDSDRPLYVAAESWESALRKWRVVIQMENLDDDCSDAQPYGIALIAESHELVIGLVA